ncbi:hypothetical protein BDR22DRAFT_831001 [Usnea florida]
MPQDDNTTTEQRSKQRSAVQGPQSPQRWFTTPKPIRRLFDKFPLQSYSINELPQRSPRNRDRHTLWIFTTKEGAQLGAPSFNPGCLKWQAYLIFKGVDFLTIPSNNHASPSGALPFLIPASSSKSPGEGVLPVPSTRIERWVREYNFSQKTTGMRYNEGSKRQNQPTEIKASTEKDPTSEDSSNMRYEAYMSLLNYRIRNGYVGTSSIPLFTVH